MAILAIWRKASPNGENSPPSLWDSAAFCFVQNGVLKSRILWWTWGINEIKQNTPSWGCLIKPNGVPSGGQTWLAAIVRWFSQLETSICCGGFPAMCDFPPETTCRLHNCLLYTSLFKKKTQEVEPFFPWWWFDDHYIPHIFPEIPNFSAFFGRIVGLIPMTPAIPPSCRRICRSHPVRVALFFGAAHGGVSSGVPQPGGSRSRQRNCPWFRGAPTHYRMGPQFVSQIDL